VSRLALTIGMVDLLWIRLGLCLDRLSIYCVVFFVLFFFFLFLRFFFFFFLVVFIVRCQLLRALGFCDLMFRTRSSIRIDWWSPARCSSSSRVALVYLDFSPGVA